MKLVTGTSGYSYPQWRGRFYPDALPDDEMLGFYAGKLPTVEINSTFYRMPKREVLETWASRVPASFVFVIKASQRISHKGKLAPPEAFDSMQYLWKQLASLGDKLGPVLIQTPPWLKRDAGLLREFISATIPAERRVALELASSSWDTDEIDQICSDRGVARVIADKEDGTARVVRTAPWIYARLRKDEYTPAEQDAWLDRLASTGADLAYVFLKHEDTARGAELALELGDRYAKRSSVVA
jgi:uncharacterized protein YecE (DUF72 family)